MVSDEQISQIKKQLIQQIESTFPEGQKAQMVNEVQNMDNQQLIEFLKQNNLIKDEADLEKSSEQQCIFCALAQKQMPSTIIEETDEALAILELNPISEGHTIVIPKQHITKPEEIPQEVQNLATKLGEKLQKVFNPKRVDVAIRNVLGHEAINLIPIYEDETIDSSRNQSTPEDLAKIKEKIDSFQEAVEETESDNNNEPRAGGRDEEVPEEINEENTWLPKRIP